MLDFFSDDVRSRLVAGIGIVILGLRLLVDTINQLEHRTCRERFGHLPTTPMEEFITYMLLVGGIAGMSQWLQPDVVVVTLGAVSAASFVGVQNAFEWKYCLAQDPTRDLITFIPTAIFGLLSVLFLAFYAVPFFLTWARFVCRILGREPAWLFPAAGKTGSVVRRLCVPCFDPYPESKRRLSGRLPRGTGDACPPLRLVVAIGIATAGWIALAVAVFLVAFLAIPYAEREMDRAIHRLEQALEQKTHMDDDSNENAEVVKAFFQLLVDELHMLLQAVSTSLKVGAVVVIVSGIWTTLVTLRRYQEIMESIYRWGHCDRSTSTMVQRLKDEQDASPPCSGQDVPPRLRDSVKDGGGEVHADDDNGEEEGGEGGGGNVALPGASVIGATVTETGSQAKKSPADSLLGAEEGEGSVPLPPPWQGVRGVWGFLNRRPPKGGTPERENPLEPRAAGLLVDTTLESYAFDNATTFISGYAANTTVVSALLFVVAFIVVFCFSYPYIRALFLPTIITLLLAAVAHYCLRWCIYRRCLANRERLVRRRFYICCDAIGTISIGAAGGAATAAGRAVLAVLAGLVQALRVDTPVLPRPFHSFDPCFASWAAMIRCRQYEWTHAAELQAEAFDRSSRTPADAVEPWE